MAKKFVLNEQTMMTLGFVILVVMLLSAMSCGKKENYYQKELESPGWNQRYINGVGAWPAGVNSLGQCRQKCTEDQCNAYTWFYKGGRSSDPSQKCKIMHIDALPLKRDSWPHVNDKSRMRRHFFRM